MPIGRLQTEGELEAFIRDAIDRHDLGVLLRSAQARADALEARVAALEADIEWTALPYAAGWGDYGGGFLAGKYAKFRGLVLLRGMVTKSGGAPAAADVIATLPAGFRPIGASVLFGVATGATHTFGRIDVSTAGSIIWRAGSAVETDYVSLNGLYFDAT
jgi:hypothetical protein